MRMFITGAHGFIGRHLARYMSEKGHQVGGIGHGTWQPNEMTRWGIGAWANGDVTSANIEILQVDVGLPDIIFHLAGGSSVGAAVLNPREDFIRTVGSTIELLDWMRQYAPQAALVAISSAAVYGIGHQAAVSETAPLTPYSPYGYHKLMMEEVCRSYAASYGIAIAVARLFSVYGPGLKKQLLWDLCTKLASKPLEVELGGTGRELRDWTHVADVVRALDGIGRIPSTKVPVINVGTGIATSVDAIARRVISHWHRHAVLAPNVHFNGQSRPGDPPILVASAERLAKLGFIWQHEVEQGLVEYVDWFTAFDQWSE